LKVDLELIGALQDKPPEATMHALARKKIPPPRPRKKIHEEDAGRRVFGEALEEDVALTPADVHPVGSTGLPERCPHRFAAFALFTITMKSSAYLANLCPRDCLRSAPAMQAAFSSSGKWFE